MPVLTEAQQIDTFSSLKNNLQAIGLSYHLCELIDGLCPENQENLTVFDLLKNTLTKLSQICHPAGPEPLEWAAGPEPLEWAAGPEPVEGLSDSSSNLHSLINNFEIDLLTVLGYWNKAQVLNNNFNTHAFIEDLMERKLKSRAIFAKL